ncbi:hypothetical protein [Desulfobacter hydrogenophilus]|uniref:hypothetical protein n=1 Tax=Desulfobacter hydrogenophilus TaxID=2291 RepID=UPI0013D5CD7B|nr:hypothetical protein [Desulfobacter hydrogenophilus]NDY73546.1 hypothetical protein [Desulfobacter hydrogenophilus]
MIRELLSRNTIVFVFMVLILAADYAVFFGICRGIVKPPFISGQINHVIMLKENNK